MGKTFCKKIKQLNIGRKESFNAVMQDLTLTEYRVWMNLWFELEDKESVNWTDTFGASICNLDRPQYAKAIKSLVKKEYITLTENGMYCVEGICERTLSEFDSYLDQVDDETFAKDAKLISTSMPFGNWAEGASFPLLKYLITVAEEIKKDFAAREMIAENRK